MVKIFNEDMFTPLVYFSYFSYFSSRYVASKTNKSTRNIQYSNMITLFDFIILLLCCVSLLLHSFGVWLLVHTYKHGRHTGQKLYLIGFSMFEAIKALIEISLLSIAVFSTHPSPRVISIQHHLSILSETMMAFIYYSSMFSITIERLIAVTLGIKYCNYEAKNRCQRIIIGTWLIGASLGATFCLLYEYQAFYYVPYNHYVYMAMDVAFSIVSIVIYCLLFMEYGKSVLFRVSLNERKQSTSVLEMFQRSKFHTPVLLMSSFLFMMVVPDLVFLTMVCLRNDHSSTEIIIQLSFKNNLIWHGMIALNVLSDITNACIYIFAEEENRKVMRKWVEAIQLKVFCEQRNQNGDSDKENVRLKGIKETNV